MKSRLMDKNIIYQGTGEMILAAGDYPAAVNSDEGAVRQLSSKYPSYTVSQNQSRANQRKISLGRDTSAEDDKYNA